jgi:hypothetical protein
MEKDMNYYIANIDEQNGEFEYKTTIRFKAESYDKARRVHQMIVGTWYGSDMTWDENEGRYFNGYVAVDDGELTEIDEHTFKGLGEHTTLPDMTPQDGVVIAA